MDWQGVKIAIINFFETDGWTAVTFLSVLTIGILLIRIFSVLIKKALLSSGIENTLSGFISAILQFVFWLLLLFVLAEIAKIPATPLITALGAVGLALSLAIKDSLSNLANGVVLMGTKPFKAGDYVDIDGITGTVKAIKMMQTELITPDNKKVLVPNGKITSASIINYSAKPNRRIEWQVSVAYSSDINLVRKLVIDTLKSYPKILTAPAPVVFLAEKADSSLDFSARAWTLTEDYWQTFYDVNEQLLLVLTNNGIQIPFKQIDINIKNRVDKV